MISSTDSEAEGDADKGAEKTRVKAELEYGCVDDIWSEVSGDNAKVSESSDSSDIADEAADNGSHDDDLAEQLSNRRAKPLDGRPKVLYETQFADDANNEQEAPGDNANNADEVKADDARGVKRLLIEEVKLEPLAVECKKARVQPEQEKEEVGKLAENKLEEPKEEQKVEQEAVQEVEQIPALITAAESGSELDQQDARADLDKSCQKLKDIALNDNGPPTAEQLKQEAVDRMYESYGEEIFAEQPEFNTAMLEKEHSSEQLLPNASSESTSKTTSNDIIKTKEQLEYEEECAEANDIVEYNMNELSSQMDDDLKELNQPLEEIRATLEQPNNKTTGNNSSDEEKEADRKKCVELTTVTHSLRIIEEFSVRRERISEDIEKKKATEEQQKKVLTEDIQTEQDKEDAIDAAFAKALDVCTDDVPTRVFGAGCDTPSYEWRQEECMRQLTIKETRTVDSELADDDVYRVKPLSEKTSVEQAELICEEMSRQLEADENSLRDLLQQLEDETDVLYDITNVEDEILDKVPEPPLDEVCASLIHELIDELQYQEIINGQNIKCFDFGLIESDEEYSYSAEPKTKPIVPPELEDPAGGKSLRECLDAFGNFLSSVNERKNERKLDRNVTTSSEKVNAAKTLLKSKMLNAYMDESPQAVEAQLAKEQEKKKRHVAAMATRCFSKRDNFEDSLEVVDNKLMIKKKDTGELLDLPPPPALISDTESESGNESEQSVDEYDTAEEPHEENRNSREMWPKADPAELELSKEPLSLTELNDGDSAADQSSDKFYSLEARTAFNSLDSEFMDKLDLQKVIGTDGEITVEGMRSYDELTADDGAQKAENPGALVKQDEMLKDLIVRQQLQEERERQMEELSKDLGAHKLKCKSIRDQLESELEEARATTNLLVMLNSLEGPKEEELRQQLAEVQQEEPRDSDNLQELPTIKLTLGSCKICEIKSQISNEEAQQRDQVEAATEEGEMKPEDRPLNSEQIAEKAEEQTSNEKPEETASAVVKPAPNANVTIDDDIISDTSTDYESGEDIPVVEPPRLPEGALNELFSNQFDKDGLKLERENEDALRKQLFSLPLRAWASQNSIDRVENVASENEKQDSESAQTTDVDDESWEVETNSELTKPEDDDETDSNGAIGELARNAKRQWAKISEKLSEFIEADELKLLDKSQFNEEESEEDEEEDELEASLKKLNIIYEECETQIKSARPENMQVPKESEVANDEVVEGDKQSADHAEPAEQNENPNVECEEVKEQTKPEEESENPKRKSEDKQPEEERQNLKSEEVKVEPEGESENSKWKSEEQTKPEEEQVKVEPEAENEKPVEVTGEPSPEHTKPADENENSNLKPEELFADQKLAGSPSKPVITLDYFEENTDDDSFHTIPELKTEEIECNLEILSDDGNAVVKEVSVSAQVTYELKK